MINIIWTVSSVLFVLGFLSMLGIVIDKFFSFKDSLNFLLSFIIGSLVYLSKDLFNYIDDDRFVYAVFVMVSSLVIRFLMIRFDKDMKCKYHRKE